MNARDDAPRGRPDGLPRRRHLLAGCRSRSLPALTPRSAIAAGRWRRSRTSSPPASIAVIGASARPGSVGAALLDNLRASFDGPVYASAAGSRCATSTRSGRAGGGRGAGRRGRGRRARCAAKGVRRCWSSPPASRTPRERRARARLAELLPRPPGMRLVGPNCLGVAEPVTSTRRSPARGPSPGAVALLSQSGGIGIAALEQASRHGFGLSAFVSIGDRADISSNDVLQWWEQDPSDRRHRALPGVVRQPAPVRAHRAPGGAHASRSSPSRPAARRRARAPPARTPARSSRRPTRPSTRCSARPA